MSRIVAVCKSDKKGTRKTNVKEGILKEDFGLNGDAHSCAGNHRQLSLLSMGSIEKMRKLGADVGPGDFAENLTIEGNLVLYKMPVGTRLQIGDGIVLEVTQIGKECHAHCAIFQQVGTCVMPLEGIFTRVIKGGSIKTGDEIRVL
jgi:MOSC domain-containing protein YiiM